MCVSANLNNNFPTLNYRVFSVENKVFCAHVFPMPFLALFSGFPATPRGLVFGTTLISFNKPTPPSVGRSLLMT